MYLSLLHHQVSVKPLRIFECEHIIGILPEVTTNNQNELREAIRHERRVELGMEFDRFYDLVRWGIAKEVLHAAGKTGYQAASEAINTTSA
jgi:hypothetical protein